jgi:hypothetical protein
MVNCHCKSQRAESLASIAGRTGGDSANPQYCVCYPKDLLNRFVWWLLISKPVLDIPTASASSLIAVLTRLIHRQVRHSLNVEFSGMPHASPDGVRPII